MEPQYGQTVSLPQELLVEIFLWCLGNIGVHLPPSESKLFLPWKFGHVCSSWRHIVLTEPRLWNSVTLHKKPNENSLPVVEEVFRRSGQLPLVIRTSSSSARDEFISNTVKQYAPRIRHLLLEPFIDSSVDAITSSPAGLFNSLETLYISWTSSSGSLFLPARGIRTFEGIPTLRRVKVTLEHESPYDPSFHMSLTDLHIPWNQLTHLDISDTRSPLSVMLYVFTHLCNLVECRLYLSDQERYSGFSEMDLPSPPDRFVLPKLQTLRIDILNTKEDELIRFDNIFLRTAFPNLQRFDISQNRRDRQLALSPASFVEHLRSSQRPLTHLTFDGVWEWDLGYLLENMPSLVRLSSLTASIGPLTLKLMAQGGCAANLEYLACRIGVADIDDLLAVLEMRWSQEHQARMMCTPSLFKPLRKVVVTVVESLPAKEKEEWEGVLKRLEELGEKYGIATERARIMRFDEIVFNWPGTEVSEPISESTS
jgi:hypothetical protein